MATYINADDGIVSGVAGLKYGSDSSGSLVLQTNGTTAITISAAQAVTFSGTVSFATASFTNLSYTGTLTGGTGIVNIGSGQIYKDSSGNVGIGTSSPGSRLVINGGTGATQIRFEVSPSTYTQEVSTNAAQNAYVYKSVDASYHVWKNSSSEVMRIDSSGNVGIGTTGPNYKLSVNGTGNIYAGVAGLGRLFFGDPNDPSGYVGIYRSALGPANYNTAGQGLNFASFDGFTFNAGTAVYGSQTERMRIDSGGNVCIGTTSALARITVLSSGGADSISSTLGGSNNNYATFIGKNASGSNTFFVTGLGQINAVSTSINAISDARLKTNIQPIKYGLETVVKLKPVMFDFIENDLVEGQPDNLGFIAQDVQSIIPELVSESRNKAKDDTAYLTLKMGDMLPVLVKAIQEQQVMLEQLKAEVAALKG